MITIIKPGVKPAKKRIIYTVICPVCGCEFEFDQEDTMAEKRLDGNRYINCPYCDNLLCLANVDYIKTREEDIVDE